MTQPVPVEEKSSRSSFMALLERVDDGDVMRWTFRVMLAGVVTVLGVDLYALQKEAGGLWPSQNASAQVTQPVLPPAVETPGSSGGSRDPREHLTTDEATLKDPLQFELRPGGVLEMTGSIDLGSAQRFAQEVEARGEYVQTISLDSPGGSLDDAMSIARLIREKGLATRVDDGALCASSCPLVLAGGTDRTVDAKAAVGLHQFYAGSELPAAAQAMSDAQVTAARISRYLAEMGVDPAMWLHALDTPPRALYYLSSEEMAQYKLVTTMGPLARLQ